MRIADLKQTVKLPEGVTVTVAKSGLTIQGKHGTVTRAFHEPRISITQAGNIITVASKNATKKQKRLLMSIASHIENAIEGAQNNNEYKMKICSSHFPMQVSMEGSTMIVKNFFGEKIPRKTTLPKEVQVKVQADKVIITGPDIEKVGMAASKIELVCRISNKDRRVFQDGIFLTERNGKPIV